MIRISLTFFLILSLLGAFLVFRSVPADAIQARPESAHVFFLKPTDGAEVSSPVQIEMGVEGMKVVPLGPVQPKEGHHHLIIDGTFIKEGEIVPADAQHLHFGKGNTTASVPLKPGKHTLTLQFADGLHKSYGEKLSKTIQITVKP